MGYGHRGKSCNRIIVSSIHVAKVAEEASDAIAGQDSRHAVSAGSTVKIQLGQAGMALNELV